MPMEFFSAKKSAISTDLIAQWFQDALIDGEIETDEDETGLWTQIALYTEDGDPVVEIDKFARGDAAFDDYIADVVRRLLDDKEPVKPHSAVKWLCNFMTKVQTVYVLRPQQSLYDEPGWEIFNEFWTNLKDLEPGIVHCQGEGFTNEQGAQITWEFPAGASGDWKMALFDSRKNSWIEFSMDLANQEQRSLFLAGTLPFSENAKSPSDSASQGSEVASNRETESQDTGLKRLK